MKDHIFVGYAIFPRVIFLGFKIRMKLLHPKNRKVACVVGYSPELTLARDKGSGGICQVRTDPPKGTMFTYSQERQHPVEG